MPLAPTLAAHGARITAIGFGTSGLGDVRAEHVAAALKAGYRHIDTARKYGTERVVGEGIRASGVPRQDVFLCTKVSHENLHAADFARSVEASLAAGRDAPLLELTYNWDAEDYGEARYFGHLAFEVDDIYATCERLMKNGVTINRPPRDGYIAFIRSPDNISIELLQKGKPKPKQEPWVSMPNSGKW